MYEKNSTKYPTKSTSQKTKNDKKNKPSKILKQR